MSRKTKELKLNKKKELQGRPVPEGPGIIQEKTHPIIPSGVNSAGYGAKPPKRFNEMDVAILEETAGIEIEEVAVRLEIKMNHVNKEIDLINDQIELYTIINPKDRTEKLRDLLMRQDEAEKELANIKAQYHSLGEFYKFSDRMSDTIEKAHKSFKKNTGMFSKSKIGQWSFGVIPFLRSRSYLLGTLDKLNTLYKKMETIVNLKHIPYGEKEDTINDLVEFMRTANQLESRMNTFFLIKKNENQ